MFTTVTPQDKIRNLAIIAHVDHGKTTLVDAFMKQSNLFRDNQDEMQQTQILDSGDLEREKGITINAKNISVRYKGYKINIVDTPGHADFAGEVERTLNMADGCLLLVDAQEGPMPQTKFVLKKAFELGLVPIVVINKIDKKLANIPKVISRVQDLFLTLATKEEQLDFPIIYAIGREGKAWLEMPSGDLNNPGEIPGDLTPLMDKIVEHIPSPVGEAAEPFQMQITTISFDPHQGRFLIGKIRRGTVKINDPLIILSEEDGEKKTVQGRVKRILLREGLQLVDVDKASAGEIIGLVGIDTTAVGGTICDLAHQEMLPMLKISPPSVKIKFEANTSPFVGKDGKFVTAKQLQERLEKEAETNISMKIEKGDGGAYFVSGRGELQLSILIETMRREGYEFQITRPQVIFQEIEGKKHEPIEELTVETPDEFISAVNQELSIRRAELINAESENGHTRFTYKILTRNLLGLRRILLTSTKGNLNFNSFVLDYVPFKEIPEVERNGVIVSADLGTATGYSLNTIQDRGQLFIEANTDVYEGMIIGINKYESDLDVNPVKARHKSGVRVAHDTITVTALRAPIQVTLEYALCFINNDEMIEVTPNFLRMRKLFLSRNERDWAKRKNLSTFAQSQMKGKI